MTFGTWLGAELQRKGLRPADLAREANVSAASISRWLRDLVTPDPASCRTIATALDIDPDIVLVRAEHRPDFAAAQDYDLHRRFADIQTLLAEAQLPGPNMARIPLLRPTPSGAVEDGVAWLPSHLLAALAEPAVLVTGVEASAGDDGHGTILVLLDRAAEPSEGDTVACSVAGAGPHVELHQWPEAADVGKPIGVVKHLSGGV